ncbi:MAG: hypothetical protein SH850_15910, partial [Planctomycetaceae bacterium]|nr:hypothetical protein [Planctomycetaceae bacterium]
VCHGCVSRADASQGDQSLNRGTRRIVHFMNNSIEVILVHESVGSKFFAEEFVAESIPPLLFAPRRPNSNIRAL